MWSCPPRVKLGVPDYPVGWEKARLPREESRERRDRSAGGRKEVLFPLAIPKCRDLEGLHKHHIGCEQPGDLQVHRPTHPLRQASSMDADAQRGLSGLARQPAGQEQLAVRSLGFGTQPGPYYLVLCQLLWALGL